MKQLPDLNGYDSLFVCGDIHGEFKTLIYEIKRREIVNAVIIVAGDCGIGFEELTYYEQLYGKLKKTLQKSNCLLLLMRGNHDDPLYFQKELLDFPLMKTISDYTVIQFKTHSILCVGGAISVDRLERLTAMWLAGLKGRKNVKCYWENEMPKFDSIALSELKANGILIDNVVTHTSPSFCMPLNKSDIEGWLFQDEKLKNDIKQERAVMDEIYNYLLQDGHPLVHWFYGHFHNSHIEYISDICSRMLNIMELCELKIEKPD